MERKEGTVRQKLEFPSEHTSTLRKQVLVQKLLKQSSNIPPTFRRVERSAVLEQVKSFIPKLKVANAKLDSSSLETLEVGTVPPDQKNYVEMNIQLYEESSDSEEELNESPSNNLAQALAKPALMTPLILDITDQTNSRK